MKNDNSTDKLLKEFLQWGSGFTLEADRDYKTEGDPLWFNLTMYGLMYGDDDAPGTDFSGDDLFELMKMAIKVGKKNQKELREKYPLVREQRNELEQYKA